MAWLESHQELADHPKTKRAARRLGIGIPQMIGHLHCLWWWAMDYAPDGDLIDFDDEDIAEAARWEGNPGDFIDALQCCGTGDGPGFLTGYNELNDWDSYGGKYVKRREQARDRQRKKRASDGDSDGSHADVTRESRVSHTPTGQDKREQERREEGAALEANAAADDDTSADLSEAERAVAGYVREIRGMANVPAQEIIGHIRECLEIRGSPVSELTMRRELRKFRDHHESRRQSQPANQRWRGWKNALTNWIERIPDEPSENGMSMLDALYPELQPIGAIDDD